VELTPELFKALVRIVPGTECWEYTGAKDSHGYGRVFIAGKEQKAQRVAYELLVGPLSGGARLRHYLGVAECIGHACCNPAHLRATIGAMGLTGISPDEPGTCKKGHVLTPENMVIERRGGTILKRCRICRREAWRGWKAERA
jgi:hypothetical protein